MSSKSQPYIMVGIDLFKEVEIRNHIINNVEDIPDYAKDDESEILYLITERLCQIDEESLYHLHDGMDGKYSILGVVIHHGDQYSGMDYKTLSIEEIEQMRNKCRALFKEMFHIEVQPDFHFVSHWS